MSRKIRYSGYSFASCPIEAVNFLNATGITDATITSAICTLVKDLKDNSLWSKMKAVYPMVGGVATTHKFNLKDPQDLDSAFRLDFSGGWTHSSNGALPNGTNAFANTYLNTQSELNNHDTHLSFYSRTDSSIAGSDIGAGELGAASPTKSYINLLTKWSDSNFYTDMNSYGTGRISQSLSSTPSTRLFVGSRIANNLQFAFRDGVQLSTDNTTLETISLPNRNITIGGANMFGANRWSNKECAFATVGDGLTKSEISVFNTIIKNFQTTLGRNV